MIRPTDRISSSPNPRLVVAGVPIRIPEAVFGGFGSNGMPFLLTVIPISSRRCSASLPVTPSGVTSTSDEVVVGAARDEPQALRAERLGHGRALARTWRW